MTDEASPKKRPARKRSASPRASTRSRDSDEASATSDDEHESSDRAGTLTASAEAAAQELIGQPEPSATDRLMTELNGLVLGVLTLHYQQRDVALPLDGATASRVIAVFARTADRRSSEDRLVPGISDMTNLWASLDLGGLLAVSWFPGLPSSERMTVDPPPMSRTG